MISPCSEVDAPRICELINSAARAYEGVIPTDCWHDPYMSIEELRSEIDSGVSFIGFHTQGALTGVMAAQPVQDVTLIRHAYVSPNHQGRGIGHQMLEHLVSSTSRPILVGTWTSATWAIHFYERNGFHLTLPERARSLLARYWSVPERQMAVSSVLERTSPLKP